VPQRFRPPYEEFCHVDEAIVMFVMTPTAGSAKGRQFSTYSSREDFTPAQSAIGRGGGKAVGR